MTNKEKWLSYTDGLSSPQSYIDWAWRFVVSSSLQRRVWFGAAHMQCFPNMYVILVGKPGVGKGITIKPATELLKFHKRKDFAPTSITSTEGEKLVLDRMEASNLEDAKESMIKLTKGAERVEPTLFPYAPDATTYEALVEGMSKSGRRINFQDFDKDGNPKLGIYYHCSMFFSLEELGSLMRKRTEDTMNYLLGLYDCPLDYEYKTKNNGEARVRRGCLNILAGTTPTFMESVFTSGLLDQGFSSRAFFIYAARNRKNIAFPEALTKEQQQYRLDLLDHIKKLATLYGEVKIDSETRAWIQNWWDNAEDHRSERPNTSPKLDPYYARKNIHMIKVAMANHFSESTEMTLSIDELKQAVADLDKEEKTMHLALSYDSENPIGKLTEKVLEYVTTKRSVNMADLLTQFWRQCPEQRHSMEQALEYLVSTSSIEAVEETDEVTGNKNVAYKPI